MVEVDDEVFFSLPDIRVENIITEVIDNSLDAGADSIILDLFHDISADPPSFGFAVFDNGRGFGSAASMRKAHRLGHLDDKKEYERGMIGNFMVGFKLSTLSRFNLLSTISEHKGKLVEMHTENPDLNGLRYDVEGKENPHANRHNAIEYAHLLKILKDEQMKTVVIGAYPKEKLLSGNAHDGTRLKGLFPHHLCRFLGIIYEKYLLDGVSIQVRHGTSVELEVEPIDPFWAGFSPEALAEESRTNTSKVLKTAASRLAKFGTVVGKKKTVVVSELGKLTVQPFVIPHEDVRVKIKANFPDLMIGDHESRALTTGDVSKSKVGSDILQATNTGGIYWYRGRRCINFGGTQKQNNGFYRLPGGPNANWANVIRIKVEYSEELDSLLRLHPNKAYFRSIDDAIWEELEDILSLSSGGDGHAPPYGEELPFLKYKQKGNRTTWFDSIWKETKERSKKIESCAHCSLVHSKGELCPDEPCSKCGKSSQGCTSRKCKYVCTQCDEPGHAEVDCHLNCDDCDKLGGHPPEESCPRRCSDHDQSLPCQVCPCEDCGKPTGECECEKICEDCREVETDCVCDQSESEIVIHSPTEVDLFLFKKNREYNVDAIIKTMKNFGITIEDLEEGWTED